MTDYVIDEEHPHLGGNIAAGDSWTYCPSVWRYTLQRFAVRSVLDLGSGTGIASAYFAQQGCSVIAVEGLEQNVLRSRYPAIKQDITKGPVFSPVDLVHCHEVVEHIDEQYLDNLLKSLMNGRIILMTAAGPDQPGHHHINLQPEQYWIDHLQDRGCRFLEDDTQRIRQRASKESAWHMARSGMLFYNPARDQ